jgi:IS605 OrfB family transposase
MRRGTAGTTPCTAGLGSAGRVAGIRDTAAVPAASRLPDRLPPTGETVGVDVGLKDFAVLSTGERIPNPHHLAKRERNLARYQCRMARCTRGSANRAKAKRKVARAHSKVRDARRDFLPRPSTALVRRFDRIGVEDLNVAGMVRNRSLAKAISDVGWGEFRSMISYKAERAGRRLVVINRCSCSRSRRGYRWSGRRRHASAGPPEPSQDTLVGTRRPRCDGAPSRIPSTISWAMTGPRSRPRRTSHGTPLTRSQAMRSAADTDRPPAHTVLTGTGTAYPALATRSAKAAASNRWPSSEGCSRSTLHAARS